MLECLECQGRELALDVVRLEATCEACGRVWQKEVLDAAPPRAEPVPDPMRPWGGVRLLEFPDFDSMWEALFP